MMIAFAAYQNDLHIFAIFLMQFALPNDLCIPVIICCENIGCESKKVQFKNKLKPLFVFLYQIKTIFYQITFYCSKLL